MFTSTTSRTLKSLAQIALICLLTTPAWAKAPVPPDTTPSIDAPDQDTYTNVDGQRIRRPRHSSSKPVDASAKCRDGSYSFSTHRRGTCSGHGGVAEWYKGN